MKIPKKVAVDVLALTMREWTKQLESHGEGKVDLSAFAHMIIFRATSVLLMTAVDLETEKEMGARIAEAMGDGMGDALSHLVDAPEPPEALIEEQEAERPRILH